MTFVEHANLPLDVNTVLIGQRYASYLERPLKDLGIEGELVPENPFVDPRLSGHVDLSVFHAGDSRIDFAPFLRHAELEAKLKSWGGEIRFLSVQQGERYPQDAQFNACVVGSFFLYAKHTAATEIVNEMHDVRGATPIICKQGYTRCSVCPVTENAIITADAGIARQVSRYGLDVLLVQAGYVELSGFPYGFLGGAAFKLSRDTLAFTGSLAGHPDEARVLSFLEEHGIQPVFLTNGPLLDIGGAIPIIEKDHSP